MRMCTFVAALALAGLLWWLLEGTRLGAIVRGGSESPSNMALLGYNTMRINTAVFGFGAGLAGLSAALEAWAHGDAVIVVGKGHDVGQLVGTEKLHFDDREEMRRAIQEKEAQA